MRRGILRRVGEAEYNNTTYYVLQTVLTTEQNERYLAPTLPGKLAIRQTSDRCRMTSTRNSTVFRVTGLTTTQPDDVLAVVLKAAIHGNLLEEERSVIQDFAVIVPSCYDEESERVALVEFRGGVPKFLAELVVNPLENWQAEMDDDTDITFDRHFFGFTQLYAPKGDMSVTAE